MAKTLQGIVLSVKMNKTVVMEVTERRPHPMYKKLIRHSKKFKAASGEHEMVVGDTVEVSETRPMGSDKHFKVTQIIKKKE